MTESNETISVEPCVRCGHPPDWHRLDDGSNVSPVDPNAQFRFIEGLGKKWNEAVNLATTSALLTGLCGVRVWVWFEETKVIVEARVDPNVPYGHVHEMQWGLKPPETTRTMDDKDHKIRIIGCKCGHVEKAHIFTALPEGGACLACNDCSGFEPEDTNEKKDR